ncbi:leucine--tRNA ligase [candidate division TM6 bacterium RIFCSPHIGHO2_12_FULL_36_22]|nr:MAG: leucine--tRNA ligase [candidate division TM6 bacterium RIFCSPHIGHO2_12_FULL_36_22]
MNIYDPKNIEKRWKQEWRENPIGLSKPTGSGKKYYCLDMFPYPSGAGLHVGHWKSYVLSDIYARIKWLQGYNVLHPMGWDAFGLPAENDAIKNKIHPAINTAKNIANFKKQLQDIGALYDWTKEINTTDPNYYKWTQWIFLQMYNAGLAYLSTMPINWCPSCKTGLANEEVINNACERCSTIVEQKEIPQWMLRITDYAEKLLSGLDTLDWPEKVKLMQRNWIGKSHGARINFSAINQKGDTIEIPVYTTRPDTIFGTTFLVMAPDHELANQLVTPTQKIDVEAYQNKVRHMSNLDRQEDKEKTGVFSGTYVINPVNQKKIPLYFASYVLKDYGTGIVMGVPGGDERDFEFATLYNIPIIQVVDSPNVRKDASGKLIEPYSGDGIMINSDFLNGIDAKTEALPKIIKYLEEHNIGKGEVQYKLRDWIFSRQRYWGEPIPLIHCKTCGTVPVPENQLPVLLPDVENYEPTGTGESPLAAINEWVNTTCPQCGGPAKRETNTMPQWAGSCWYFLRYPNPNLKDKPFDKADIDYWLPVDLYVGGIEHAILHLLYARFYIKVLHDLGYLPFDEPFKQLFNQGMILKKSTKSGLVEKMSKSKGNVVNPDDIVNQYGSDVLRLYILFMGPPELDCEWQDSGLEGIKRFLMKVWNYFENPENILSNSEQEDHSTTKRVHRALKEFQTRVEQFKPNTAISAMMEFFNDITQKKLRLSKQSAESILVTLSIMAPFMATELLATIIGKKLQKCSWPVYNQELAQLESIEIAVQVNGKTRGTMDIPHDADKNIVEQAAKDTVAKWLEGKEIIKTIYVPKRLVNFVIR